MAKLKFLEEVPSARTGRKSFFTDEIIADLKENESLWAPVDVSAPAAKKFVTENPGFKYKTRTSDKTKKSTRGNEVKVVEVYVTYDPKGKAK